MIGNAGKDVEMSMEEFTMIRDYIHEKAGIYFAENKMYLIKNRLSKRMAELDMKTVRDYFYHVKYDVSLKEFNHLMTLVTTNETSFYRNEPQLKSFSDEVLPLLVKEKRESGKPKTIKIWSAGCSTGEEPYTLATILLEGMVTNPGWKIEIIANDISEAVLKKARLGEYTGITLRNMNPTILDRYFEKRGEMYRVKPVVKSLVKFSHINLNEPRRAFVLSGVDCIFCRNVMIYFSDEIKRELVRGFYNALQPGGYFYIGHSETLHGISKAFKLVYFKNALVYQKEAGVQSPTASRTASSVELGVDRKPALVGAGAAGGAQRALDLLAKIKPLQKKK